MNTEKFLEHLLTLSSSDIYTVVSQNVEIMIN